MQQPHGEVKSSPRGCLSIVLLYLSTQAGKHGAFLAALFRRIPIASLNGAVLSRRPVAERRHLSRVLCGFTCPLRYAPSASVVAGAIQLRYGGH